MVRRLVVFGWLACVASARGELKVDRPIVDLGEVRGGQRVSAPFEFSNAGTEPIELLDMERSCGCVQPQWQKRSLAAGEKSSVVLELRTLGQTEGMRTWSAQIVYREAGVIRKTPIAIRGDLKHDIVVQPAHLAMAVRGELSQDIVVQDRRSQPFRILAVRTEVKGVSLEMRDEGNGRTRVVVRAKAGELPMDRQSGMATLLTNDPVYDRLEIPLTIERSKEAAIAVDPEQPVIRLGLGESVGAVTLRLRSRTDQAVEVDSIQPSESHIKATWTKTSTGGAAVRVQATRSGTASLHIRLKDGDELSIPIDVRRE
ncbi:MAG: DUF1573 domain-containing protein [Gemmataceae bacterium]|nr:DUF1573 domain-containing protein [Gemmataceae bacterium]